MMARLDNIWLSTCHYILDDFMTSVTDSVNWSHVETGSTARMAVRLLFSTVVCQYSGVMMLLYEAT